HEIMERCGVLCASSRVFTEVGSAREYAESLKAPFVIKADGVAAGKGAVIVSNMSEAGEVLEGMMVRRVFGDAGKSVVIEEFLSGREVSLLAFSDGVRVASMVPSCDYKRAGDGDSGLNTGGMGCYSPPGFFSRQMVERATEAVLEPVVRTMAADGTPYKGVLYAGLMVDGDTFHVLEFNARFGDPETQVILPLLESDLLEVMLACHAGTLDPDGLRWRSGCSVGVVIASGGYPGHYERGHVIAGLETLESNPVVFHAGTRLDDAGRIITDGGRVLNVVATGETMAEARARAYQGVSRVHFDDMMYRTDIALREVA
ncbi:MAG: phosphoribosylamine--glycine ligase, partial [Dehalococcoidia bacterium]|nr:phosphoribosylamine--glycine ligase [Dehalococcoidia bacterium]